MKETRPVMLLDVDGVLNVPGPDHAARDVRLTEGPHAWILSPKPITLPFLKWAWKHFSVHWLTAWHGSANLIAEWAGLARAPVVGDIREHRRLVDSEPVGGSGNQWRTWDWKFEAVKRRFGRRRGAVVWIEDGIAPEAEEWVKARPNFRYFGTDSFTGVTPDHVRGIAAFARLPVPVIRRAGGGTA